MTNQSRRPSRNLSRRERRTAGTQAYRKVPAAPATPLRRSYMVEPAPVDYAQEYRFIRKDLLRILLWATVLIVAMIVLSFLPIADNLAGLFQ